MKLKEQNLLIVKNITKKRLVRTIWKNDYEDLNTARLGMVFGIMDINLGVSDNSKIFDIIQEGIKRYYKNPLECDVAFDDFINFLNRRIEQLLDNKKLKEEANIIIGVSHQNNLLFCATGHIYAYFIYAQGIKRLYPEESTPINVTNKLFTYSLNGFINKNQTLYFCNQSFNQKINPFYLEKALKSYNHKETIQAIQDNILKNQDEGGFSAFFFYSNDKVRAKKEEDSTSGIIELINKQEKVKNNISPSIINKFKNFLKQKSIPAYILSYTVLFLKTVYFWLKKIFLFMIFLIVNGFFIATNIKGKRREGSGIIMAKFKSLGIHIKDIYRTFTFTSKLIFISLVITSLAFVGFIYYNIHRQEIKKLYQVHSQKIELAKDSLNQADSHLLFNEKNIAIAKIKEGLLALDSVPKEIREDDYQKLYSQLKNKLYKIQNISEITSMVIIADFTKDTEFEPTSPIILNDNKLKISGKNNVANIKTSGQNLGKIPFIIKGINTPLNYYYKEKNTLYSIQSNTVIQASNIDNQTSKLKEVTLHNNENIKSFAIFNDKLYVASSLKNQFSIWKHSPSLAGFGKPTLSINDNLPANANIIGVRVDGNIFVLFSNNQIYKYYKGIKQNWNYDLENIPGNEKYFKMETNQDYKYIYLLSKKQISILSKNGEFIAHMLFPNLKEIKDFAIDEDNKTIYILSDKKIYAFSINI